MKKLLFIFVFLISFFSFSQENVLGGTPVDGVTPIKRKNIQENSVSTDKSVELVANFGSSPSPSSPTGNSTEVGVTQGQLSVSLTGGATYTIPIAVPPGINGIEPQIALTYNSQGGNGLAGYGWNISGVSTITRIPATKYHDDTIDAVDFNSLDRFAFDGQRLIAKNSTDVYGASGTVYETENFSNVKIISNGVHPSGANYGPASFTVLYPDGSKAYYGYSTNARSITDWAIKYWENPQGVRISYEYINSNNTLTISKIKYGSLGSATPINEINFVYSDRVRPEQAYVGGQNIVRNTILSEVKVIGNGVGYKNYYLAHNTTSLDYERLISVTEKSGDNSKSLNPTVFNYDTTTSDDISFSSVTSDINISSVRSDNSATIQGDFDGDGKMDFIMYPTTGTNNKKKYWLFTEIGERFGLSFNNSFDIGFEHNVGSFDDIFPTSWLDSNNKLMARQGWCTINTDNTSNITTFNNYSTMPVSAATGLKYIIGSQYTKTYQFPQAIIEGCSPNNDSPRPGGPILDTQRNEYVNIPKEYISGDFNGDGLTDVIVVEKPVSMHYYSGRNCEYYNSYTRSGGTSYFLNLDRRITTDYVSYAGYMQTSSDSKFITSDFNGDGKTDIFVFDNGVCRVYTLNEAKSITLLTTFNSSNINTTKPVLMGDYNGDGKADFIMPKENGSPLFTKYISTGTQIIANEVNLGIGTYFSGTYYGNNSHIQQIIPNDFNKDGKTDIIIATHKKSNSLDPSKPFPVFDRSIQITHYKNSNNITFQKSGEAKKENINDLEHFPIPVFLSFDKAAGEQLSFISNKSIYNVISSRNNKKDTQLQSIILGNGVKESITYRPLSDSDSDFEVDNVFRPSYTETYPNLDIKVANDFQVVSKLEQTANGQYKQQKFNYYGAVSNVEGLGFLGFRALTKTNWFNDDNPVISSITKYDISKRGAVSESISVLGNYINFYNYTPTDFITKSVFSYEAELLPNKVYKIKNTISETFNNLDNANTSKKVTNFYDNYNNPEKSIVEYKLGNTVQKTETTEIVYTNVSSSTTHIIGRPNKKNTKLEHGGSTITSEEKYSYNTSRLLSKIEKKGNGINYITENNEYDTFGNITQKTIAADDITPRVTKYEYDPSGRFLTNNTDIEGLKTTFNYNTSTGQLLKETNPYGLATTYQYDSWGKKIKETNYLGKSKSYLFERAGRHVKVTTLNDDGGQDLVFFDDLGRETFKAYKNINDFWNCSEISYDIYNREIKISEPYLTSVLFENEYATQFTTSKYDAYGRLVETDSYTGKITDISYNGLSTTVTDGSKTVTTTKDAAGHTVSTTDNGGTINYTYFADGNLKSSDYNGTKIEMEYDEWGNKTKLTDPSAGVYEYKQNALGELTYEKTPNGVTEYKYDDFGKIKEKTIKGTNTDSKTTYTYDPIIKLVTEIEYTDNENSQNNSYYSYTYDNYKRLWRTVESKTDVQFTFAVGFDVFGRINKEHTISNHFTTGKSLNKLVRKEYKNGYHYQILDNATNQVLWQTNTTNARNQLTNATLGNGITIAKTYDDYGYLTQSKHDLGSTNVMTLNTTFERQRGNLTSRYNSLFNKTENFEYDNLDRLTHYTDARGNKVEQIYENDGRIKQNTLGEYSYKNAAKKYQNTSINLTPSAKAYYENRLGLFNDDMESQQGWAIYEPTVVTFDSSVSNSGNVSLKIANTTTGEKVVHSNYWINIDNAQPTEYTYSVKVKSDGTNPNAEIFLFMKTATETGYFTLVDQKISSTTKDWVEIEKTFLVPANIKKLNIRLDNNAKGVLWFDDVRIRKTSDPVTNNRHLNISYNAFKGPHQIEEAGVAQYNFTYNHLNNRSSMLYGNGQYLKSYSADGSMEIKHNTATDEVEFVTYIGGDAYSAPVVLKSDGVTQNYLYLHRDYLGSIVAITNQTGQVVEKRLFDAWGEVLKIQDGAGNVLTNFAVLDRGYTGHEHLTSVGLIHMNGRLYDAKLHRFLQPDNFVQDPYNTQNYNRYGYVLNNPLKWVDLNGEEFRNPDRTTYNGSNGEGLSVTQQTAIGSAISTLVQNWDEWKIKQFFNKNVSDGVKSGVKWLNNNLKSANGWLNKNLQSLNRDINNFLFGKRKEVKVYSVVQADQVQAVGGGWQNNGFQSGGAIRLDKSGGDSVFDSAVPIALTAAAIDGPIIIGDAIGAVILAGATAYDATQRTFVTYTMRNAAGKVYAGRTSGYGDPYRIMMNRYYRHHMRALGYGSPILDRAVQGYQGYPAIRGREQQLIDFYGGVGSPGIGNAIRGVGYYTDFGQTMHNLSNLYFGPLAPYTGFWK